MSQHTASHWTRRATRTLAVTTATVLALSACSVPASNQTSDSQTEDVALAGDAMMTDYGLAGLDARQIIDRLDALPTAERESDLGVSIRPTELIITDAAERELTLPMPNDDFYVSIAPFVDQTHECYFHSLTTCMGEIQSSDVQMLVTDADSGAVLIDETRTTFDNGFVGIWLPRDIDVTVAIEYNGRSATTELSTSGDDVATCVTTMQLS